MKKKFEKVHSKKYGRGPQVEPGTVRIYKSGVARLSPDLAIAKKFIVSVSEGVLHLETSTGRGAGLYKTWYSSKGARSPLISLTAPLRKSGLKDFAGLYSVAVGTLYSGGKVLIISVGKKYKLRGDK